MCLECLFVAAFWLVCVCLLCWKICSYRVLQWLFAQGEPYERRHMGLYEVPLSVSLLGFGIGTMLANFHVWGIMFLLRAVLNMLVRNADPRGPMCFRCLIFCLSGPCELLFLLCFIASWTWEVVSVMLYPCMFCVALLMDMLVLCVACLTVFVNCFAMCLGVVAILLLNVMEVFCVCVEVLWWIDHVWSST